MPPLNLKTNFRYQPEQSSLNGISSMLPLEIEKEDGKDQQMTIEQTLAAIDNSTILNQFSGPLCSNLGECNTSMFPLPAVDLKYFPS